MNPALATDVALPRLLRSCEGGAPPSLDRHVAVHGPLPDARQLRGDALIEVVERAGLRGRGGAGFPMARKLTAVRAARGRPLVLANGCESEPLSAKDALLLREAPHLVLDGAQLAARAVGAEEVIIATEAADGACRDAVAQALAQRRAARIDELPVEQFAAADAFLSGQETALVSQLNGGPPRPTFVPPRPTDRGVRKRPTLVQNVETLAHLALIARHGAEWFRAIGTRAEAGSALITLAGPTRGAGVYEIEIGTPLRAVLDAAGAERDEHAAILIGGYFGAWLPASLAAEIELSNAALAPHGAALGAGVIVALPAGACPVAETVRVAVYLATQTAQQCGPCVHGTAAIARTLHGVAEGKAMRTAFADLERWILELPGRGACHHPNGLAQFVASALDTFGAQFDDHARHGPCEACAAPPVLTVQSAASPQR